MLKTIDADIFFAGNRPFGLPNDAEMPDFDALAAKVKGMDSGAYPLTEAKRILSRENARLGAGANTLDAIASIGGDAVFVIAGQQAGLFGGPLYTFYKALHAIRLAERLKKATGRNVVPLFWIASDDHDFNEVASLVVRTDNGESQEIWYSPADRLDSAPMGDIVLDETIAGAIDTLVGSVPKGAEGERYIELVRRSWIPGNRWSDAFAMQMLGMFERYGIVVFDPRWEGVKKLFVEVYRKEIDNPLESTKIINEEADLFESAFAKMRALRKPVGSTNLFLEVQGVRYPLRHCDGIFFAGNNRFLPDNIRAIIDKEPNRLSPAAAIRPVCQDAVFPTAALIAGPGERHYLSQLDRIYSLFGIERSIPWPRASFTLVDRKSLRAVEKEGMSIRDIFSGYDNIMSTLARFSLPASASADMDALERTIVEGFHRLTESIAKVDKSLVGAVEKDLGRVLHITDSIRERTLRAHKATFDVSVRRLKSAITFLYPDCSAQERRFGVDSILTVLADDNLDTLLEITSPGEEKHRIVLPGE